MPSPIRWSEMTALYGGTFDPPHAGHREAVEGLLQVPGVGRVVVIPSADPPHKPGRTPAEHRLEMCRLALGSLAQVSALEIERAERTGNPSYTYDTLIELQRDFHAPAFVIGTDQLAGLHTWNRFPELLGLCHWIVLERKPNGRDEAHRALSDLAASGLTQAGGGSGAGPFPAWRLTPPGPSNPRISPTLILVPTPARDLSSREIREEIGRSGQAPQGTLHPDVASYLKRFRLYGTQGNLNDDR